MSEPMHGSYSSYCNHACRCPECTAAWSAYMTKLRHRRGSKPVPATVTHGKDSTYINYMCRCEPCTTAHRVNRQRQREEQRRLQRMLAEMREGQ